jgi:hypothetical protein
MIIASTSNTAFAVAGEVFAQVEDFQLVGEVEERGRLVQEQDGCLLREDHGDPYFLPVAAMPWRALALRRRPAGCRSPYLRS